MVLYDKKICVAFWKSLLSILSLFGLYLYKSILIEYILISSRQKALYTSLLFYITL